MVATIALRVSVIASTKNFNFILSVKVAPRAEPRTAPPPKSVGGVGASVTAVTKPVLFHGDE